MFAPREVRLGPDGAAEEPSWHPALCAQGSGAFPTARRSVLFCQHSILRPYHRNEIQKNLLSCRDPQADICGDTVVNVTFLSRGVTTATPQDQDFLHSENRSRLPCAALRVLRYLGKQQGVGAPCPLLCSDSLALLTLPLLTVCH